MSDTSTELLRLHAIDPFDRALRCAAIDSLLDDGLSKNSAVRLVREAARPVLRARQLTDAAALLRVESLDYLPLREAIRQRTPHGVNTYLTIMVIEGVEPPWTTTTVPDRNGHVWPPHTVMVGAGWVLATHRRIRAAQRAHACKPTRQPDL